MRDNGVEDVRQRSENRRRGGRGWINKGCNHDTNSFEVKN